MQKESNNPAELPDDEILPEYSLAGGVRGKYAERYAHGTNLVRLDSDVAEIFPDDVPVQFTRVRI